MIGKITDSVETVTVIDEPEVELEEAAAAPVETGDEAGVADGAVVPLVKKAGTVPMTGAYSKDSVVLSVPSQQYRLKQASHSALREPPFSMTALSIMAQVTHRGSEESVPFASSVLLPFSIMATAWSVEYSSM